MVVIDDETAVITRVRNGTCNINERGLDWNTRNLSSSPHTQNH
jgi:hypothetical protein